MKMRGKWWASHAVSRVFLWLLVPAVAAAMQLPPEIQADRYLLEAEKQIQAQDFESAKEAMDRILALEAQHGLELPEEFFFRYAEVSDRLGLSGNCGRFSDEVSDAGGPGRRALPRGLGNVGRGRGVRGRGKEEG